MPIRISSGTMLHRLRDGRLEILLVHASGQYNANRPWGIPKGSPNAGETLSEAARRETREETGIEAPALLVDLGSIVYRRSRKQIYCFAGLVGLECEPRCASWEIDRAEFLSIEDARQMIHPDQAEFIQRLEAALEQPSGDSA